MTNLREQATRAFKWSYLLLAVNLVMQPLFAAILARLISRAEFGVLTLGQTLFILGNFIAEMGLGAALVQKAVLSEGNVRAATTSSVLLGGFMTLLAWFTAPLAGQLFHNPEVVPIFRGFAGTYIILSLSIVSTHMLRREMRFKALILAELFSYLVGHGIFGLSSAWLGFGAMSLVISTYAQNILLLIAATWLARTPFAMTLHWPYFRELYAFGSRVSLVGIIEYFSTTIDVFMIGRLYGNVTLGVYGQAYKTVCIPLLSISRTLSRVVDSSMSAVQDDQPRLRRAYFLGVSTLSVLLFPVVFGIVVCAHEIVLVLLGRKFIDAVPIVQVLALYIPFPVLANLSSSVATATARLNVRIWIQLVYIVGLAAGFLLVHQLGLGVIAFAGVLAVAGLLRCLYYAAVTGHILGSNVWLSVRAYGTGVLCGLVVAAPLAGAVWLMRDLHLALPLVFVAELLLGGLLLLAVLVFGPPTELQGLLRRQISARLGRGRFLANKAGWP